MSRNSASLATHDVDRDPTDGGEGASQVDVPSVSTPSEPSRAQPLPRRRHFSNPRR